MRLKFNLSCVQVGIREITVSDISSEYAISSVSKEGMPPAKARYKGPVWEGLMLNSIHSAVIFPLKDRFVQFA